MSFWFKFGTHNSAHICTYTTHNSAKLMNTISALPQSKEASSKGKQSRQTTFTCHLLFFTILLLFSKIVSIILHVSSKGTHNSAHFRQTDADNSSLFNKKYRQLMARPRILTSTKVPPRRVRTSPKEPINFLHLRTDTRVMYRFRSQRIAIKFHRSGKHRRQFQMETQNICLQLLNEDFLIFPRSKSHLCLTFCLVSLISLAP